MTDLPSPAPPAPPAPPRAQRPQPFRCSALYRRHLASGATMTERAGWRTAAHFTGAEVEARRVRDGAGLGDVSWLGKLDVRGTQTDDVATLLERALGAPSASAGGAAPGLPPRVWRLARGHALVTCGPDERAELAARLPAQAASPAACRHLTDVTSVYAALLLAGPASRAILHQLTPIDVEPEALPDRGAVQGGLAHVHAILLRADLGSAADVPGYWLLVAREYGEYLWDTVLRAGHRLGIVPFGVGALDALGARP
jgi:sarcosine oxidase, subunit alpha